MEIIKKFFKAVLKGIKAAIKLISVLLVVGMLAAAVVVIYFAYPLYAPPKPTMPKTLTPEDSVKWTFRSYSGNPQVLQQLTVYRDGRSEVLITRAIQDPDVVDELLKWKIKKNKETGLVEFRRYDYLSPEKAGKMFKAALNAGVLDIKNLPYENGERLDISVYAGEHYQSAAGPDFIGATVDYPPGNWLNRIYWQKLIKLISSDPKLKKITSKVSYLITKDK